MKLLAFCCLCSLLAAGEHSRISKNVGAYSQLRLLHAEASTLLAGEREVIFKKIHHKLKLQN